MPYVHEEVKRMNKYEVVYIIDPAVEEEARKESARLLGGKEVSDQSLSAAYHLREEGEREYEKYSDILL